MNTLTHAIINCVDAASKDGPGNLKLIIEAYQKKYAEMTGGQVPEPTIEIKKETNPEKLRAYSIIHGIKTIAEERLKQLQNGHNLYSDMMYNKLQDMIDGAMFCLTLDTFYYPKKWQPKTMEKILSMDIEKRTSIAGAFLAGYLDVVEYQRELSRQVQESLMQQDEAESRERPESLNYESDIHMDDFERVISAVSGSSRNIADAASGVTITSSYSTGASIVPNVNSVSSYVSAVWESMPATSIDPAARRTAPFHSSIENTEQLAERVADIVRDVSVDSSGWSDVPVVPGVNDQFTIETDSRTGEDIYVNNSTPNDMIGNALQAAEELFEVDMDEEYPEEIEPSVGPDLPSIGDDDFGNDLPFQP